MHGPERRYGRSRDRSLPSRMAVASLVLLASWGTLSAAPSEFERVAEKALEARQKTMQQDATAADIDAFLAFCTDDLAYEDPVVKLRMEGKAAIRKGMTGFLGATRNASIVVTKRISAPNLVVIEQTVSFEEKQEDDSWKSRSRDQVTILEFEGAKIRRIADYWSR